MKPVQVLHVIASIDSSYGGPAVALEGLCGKLQTRTSRFGLLTCSSGMPLHDRENQNRFPNADLIWSKPLVRRYCWDPFLDSALRNQLNKFNVIHVHGVFNGLVSGVCRAARREKIPYILEPFGTLSDYCLNKNLWLKKISLGLFERKNIESATLVRFSSEQEKSTALKNFNIRNSIVLGHGIDNKGFDRLPMRGNLRKKLGLGDEDKLILFLGRLQPIKGLEVFLPAFLQWQRTRRERWFFAIAGPDEQGYQKKLEKILRETQDKRAFLTGPLFDEAKLEAFSDADIFCLPSLHENFGIAAAEAAACRKPILISNQTGVAQAVRDFHLGIVVAPTINGFMNGLGKMANRQDEWLAMGERGRAWVESNCQWGTIADVLMDEYMKMIKCSP